MLPINGPRPTHAASCKAILDINKTITSYRRTDERALSQLRPGDQLSGTFACSRKDRLTARNGSPYLAIELKDRSGTIKARAFKDADVLAGKFDQGDVVQVTGEVQRFRDELHVELTAISRTLDFGDPTQFLPSAYRNVEELDGFLEHFAQEVHNPGYSQLLTKILGDQTLRAEFRKAPCTRSGHHAYLGGLLEHTVAVTTLAVETGILHPRLNTDLLITAAILHDIGKTQEFTYGAELSYSRAGETLGHIFLGQQIISEYAGDLDAELKLALLHCIVCHHGAESVPGRRFASAEALALYRLNALDAGVKGALEGGG